MSLRRPVYSLLKHIHHTKVYNQPSSNRPCGIPYSSRNILSQYSSSINNYKQYNYYSTDTEITEAQIKRAIDDISDKFSEAMELMNDARASTGTVYFSEDVLDTRSQVAETLSDYQSLISKLNDKQKKIVIQSIGLKIEELKAQMALLEDLAKE